MNPFDLRGPAFLGLYVFVSAAGLLYLYCVVRGFIGDPRLPSGEARRHLRDPYLLAYLRGGVSEVLKTVTFSLNQRKLLSFVGKQFAPVRSHSAFAAVDHPLERAVLAQCGMKPTVPEMLRNAALKRVVEDYVAPLRHSALVVNDEERQRRRPAAQAVTGILLALGGVKVFTALARGHFNVLFLIVLTSIALIAVYGIYNRRRTPAGDRALSDQQTLFVRLKGRVNRMTADGAHHEAVLVAAAFGIDALPESSHPFAAQLKRLTQTDSSGGGCGSSGGSGCGGGGGGCGGCGGG
jgi:uncharacterized protein (TIGR04222 family)